MNKVFQQYLYEEFERECPGVLDDDMPDKFDAWIEGKDSAEIIEYANKALSRFSTKIYMMVVEDVPHRFQDRLLEALK